MGCLSDPSRKLPSLPNLDPKTLPGSAQVPQKTSGNVELPDTPGTPSTLARGMLRGREGGAGIGCSGAQEPGGAAAAPLPRA